MRTKQQPWNYFNRTIKNLLESWGAHNVLTKLIKLYMSLCPSWHFSGSLCLNACRRTGAKLSKEWLKNKSRVPENSCLASRLRASDFGLVSTLHLWSHSACRRRWKQGATIWVPTRGELGIGIVLSTTSILHPPHHTALDKDPNNGLSFSMPLLLHLPVIYVFPANTSYSWKPLAASWDIFTGKWFILGLVGTRQWLMDGNFGFLAREASFRLERPLGIDQALIKVKTGNRAGDVHGLIHTLCLSMTTMALHSFKLKCLFLWSFKGTFHFAAL